MTDLERFLQWSDAKLPDGKRRGHYHLVRPLVDNFKRCEESMKDRETEALRERIKDD